MNRGIARRVVFPDRIHIRYFMALLARAVRRGELEIHVLCVMSTHYHLLVRSPRGRLSEGIRRVQNEYVRFYNRRARRDGPLFRGRFRSRPVLSLRYRDLLVRYIEFNPVAAGVVARPADYPYSSAALRRRPKPPRWLATWWTDAVIQEARRFDPSATYESIWGVAPAPSQRALVRARIRRAFGGPDDLDDLVGAAPARVRAWMTRKATLADGGSTAAPLVDADTVRSTVEEGAASVGTWARAAERGPRLDLWPIALTGLLHDLAGLRSADLSERLGLSDSAVSRRMARHRALLGEDAYASRVADLAVACLDRAHGAVSPIRVPEQAAPGAE
jgi:hypothetical protein